MVPTILALLFLAQGCATTTWHKPGATDKQVAQARQQCMRETGGRELRPGERSRYIITDDLAERMAPKKIMQQARLFTACMRSKGYKLVTQ